MRTLLQTPANDLEGSMSFYEKLKFTVIAEEDPTIVSDGTICIEISTGRYARTGLKLFRSSCEQAQENNSGEKY